MRSLVAKLTISFGAVALLASLLTATGARYLVLGFFEEYRIARQVTLLEEGARELASFYREQGGWTGVEQSLSQLFTSFKSEGMHSRGDGSGPPPRYVLRLDLVDAAGARVSGAGPSITAHEEDEVRLRRFPITVQGRQVGTLVASMPARLPFSEAESGFARGITTAALATGLIGTGLAAAMGLMVARRFTAPLHSLGQAADRLARRDLGARAPEEGDEEVANLAANFNRMAAELERQDQLRRNLTADLSHELRTPVTIMRGQLESILEGALEPSPEVLLSLQDEIIRISRLLEDLQSLTRAEAGQLSLHREPRAVESLLADAVTAFGPAYAANGVSLTWHAESDLPPVLIDRDRIRQVIANLLANALRHTPEGGSVSLSASGAGGPWVAISVTDSGEGIPADELPRVFERFYRIEKSRSRSTGGSGLGLAIARGLVEAHGGQIGVESPSEGGTRFIFTLPASE